MSNFITNPTINAATWTSVASGVVNSTILNSTMYNVQLGVADTSGNITGTVELAPGDSFPFTNIPSGAQVWAKIDNNVKVNGVQQVFTGKLAAYNPA
ncbi:hypothetical protein EVB27_040 [Rhizobium phage RHph_TM16]|nr:hypothetical protein EVB27_040 [Rhizobium phage RHph_TM16]